jgi:putative MATE family efflux protein
MLLQMTSAGAMGGGVSSALARALGAGNEAAARRLVAHACVIALAVGIGFTVLFLFLGKPLYRLLGGSGGALEQAIAYSDVLFAGAVLVWLANTFAAALRGSGNTALPAAVLAATALAQIGLSGALTLGWAPFPALGIRGTATAYIASFGVAALAMGAAIWTGALGPRGADWRLEWRLFREILRVGALSSLSALQTVITAVILTGCVGVFGTAALAGYGVGVRLELLQVPIAFAIGQALVVLVGTNIGAGRVERAKRITWAGTGCAMAVSLAIGLAAALFPATWIRIFSDDPDVLAAGSLYLRIVAPFYMFLAAGIALYFAAQGAGRVGLPILVASVRLVVVVGCGLIVVAAGAPLAALFAVIALGIVLYGGLSAAAIKRTSW